MSFIRRGQYFLSLDSVVMEVDSISSIWTVFE